MQNHDKENNQKTQVEMIDYLKDRNKYLEDKVKRLQETVNYLTGKRMRVFICLTVLYLLAIVLMLCS